MSFLGVPDSPMGWVRGGLGGLALLALLVAPLLVRETKLLILVSALFFATFTMTWDFVSGYTGEISFGHAAFFGVGGYTSGMLNVYLGLPPLVAIGFGTVAAAGTGLLLGLPALRLRGPYLALVTLIAPLILLRLVTFFSPWTGGETGLLGAANTPPGTIGAEKIFFDTLPNYYLALGIFVFVFALFYVITRSDTGDVFTAIRADEDAVIASGLDPKLFKLFAFVLSGAVAGMTGGFLVHSAVGTVSPSQVLSLGLSIEVIIASIVGGMGTITGSALGGFLFLLLEELSHGTEFSILGADIGSLSLVIFLTVSLAFLVFLPEGILPWANRRANQLATRMTDGDGDQGDSAPAPVEAVLGSFEKRTLEEDDE